MGGQLNIFSLQKHVAGTLVPTEHVPQTLGRTEHVARTLVPTEHVAWSLVPTKLQKVLDSGEISANKKNWMPHKSFWQKEVCQQGEDGMGCPLSRKAGRQPQVAAWRGPGQASELGRKGE